MRNHRQLSTLSAAALLLVVIGCGHPGGRTNPAPVPGPVAPDSLLASDNARRDPVAPDSFLVSVETSRGPLVVSVHREWAPIGVDRFYRLVRSNYYDGARLFRVVPGFVAQFGLAADPKRTEQVRRTMIPDDPPRQRNRRGTVSFASAGPGTRTSQLFINLVDNARLDAAYPPIGRIEQGLESIDLFTSEYDGKMPRAVQDSITRQGNAYLLRAFPHLDFIRTMKVVKTWK